MYVVSTFNSYIDIILLSSSQKKNLFHFFGPHPHHKKISWFRGESLNVYSAFNLTKEFFLVIWWISKKNGPPPPPQENLLVSWWILKCLFCFHHHHRENHLVLWLISNICGPPPPPKENLVVSWWVFLTNSYKIYISL